MTKNPVAALVYTVCDPLFIGKGRPTTPLPPFLFSCVKEICGQYRSKRAHWYSKPRIPIPVA